MLNLPDVSDRNTNLISTCIIPDDHTIECRKTECFRVETSDREIIHWKQRKTSFSSLPDPAEVKSDFHAEIFSNLL